MRSLRVAWEAARASARDRTHRHAAALAYYALFALGPILLLSLYAAGMFVPHETARAYALARIDVLLGEKLAKAFDELLGSADASGPGLVGGALGLLVLIVTATAAFGQLRLSLNAVWGVEEREDAGAKDKAVAAAKRHSRSLAALVGSILLCALALLALAGLSSPLGLPLSVGGIWLVLTLTYRYLPDAKVAWRDAAAGALAAALILLALEVAMLAYVRAAPHGIYGVAGALLVLLLWIFAAELAVLYGAEYAQAYARDSGRDIHPDEDAKPSHGGDVTTGDPRGPPGPAGRAPKARSP